jgi:DNA-directed RNA polymerase specialized sigma24 family protein
MSTVDKIVRKYSRVWWADPQDIAQEAHLALVIAQRTYDPAKGAWEGYAWRAADLSASHFLWRFHAPCSTSSHRPEVVRGMRGVGVEALDAVSADANPEQETSKREWTARVRAALREALRGLPRPDLALDALLGEHDAVASRYGVPIDEVKRAQRRARGRVAASKTLEQLAQEMTQ